MPRKPPVDKEGENIVAPKTIEPTLQTKTFRRGVVVQEIIRETREYELITPLFGGGTEPQKADPISVIRVPSIRGQLRFWWRAIRGGQFHTLEELKESEDSIFGSAGESDKPGPSQVQLDLATRNRGKDLFSVMNSRSQRVQIHHPSSPYGYIAFPLRENNRGVVEDVTFSLSLSYPADLKPEIEAALWAWGIFGGLGTRTRRGFGALQPKSYRPRASELETEIKLAFQRHLGGNDFPPDVPHIIGLGSIKITSPHPSVPDAWKYLINELRQFRQDRPWPPGRNKPGRSRWHEADAIRILFGTTTPHSPRVPTVSKYPRAAFGLPIIFQFKSEDVAAGDPPQTTLEGRDDDQKRMASPLILRPLACADNQAVGLAVRLSGTGLPPNGIILKDAPGDPSVRADLTSTEAELITPLGDTTDVLQAFLRRLR